MVRKGELACRNGWDNDLWEPIQAGRVAGVPAAVGPADGDEFPPVERPAARSMQDDVVVGQAPVMPDFNQRTALLAYDTRLAIDEARERHRRRSAGTSNDEAMAAAEPHEAESPAAAEPVSAEQAAARQTDTDPYVRVGDSDANDGRGLAREDPFEEIPELRSDIDLPRASRQEAPPVISLNESAGAEPDQAEMVEPWFANGDPRRARLLSEVLAQRAQQAKRRGHGRFGRPRERELPLPVPVEDRRASDRHEVESEPPAPENEQQYVLLRDPRERPERPDEHVVAGNNGTVDVDVVAEADLDRGEPETWDRSAEALPALDDDDELLTIPTVDIAPEVPRACRTCRDFRPSDNGDRGWCTNKWAFSHRRMVNADELPCLTSVGCWWLPHDVIWLSTADVGRHSEPTPLVDRWLAERTTGDEAMRRRQS